MGFNIAWLQKKVKIGKNDKMLKNTMVLNEYGGSQKKR